MKNRFIILLAILLLSACATKREKALTYMNDNPEELAVLCALHFKPVIEYRPGKVVHVSDTQYVEGEPIPCPPNAKGEVVYVKGRDKIVRDTIFRTDTATVKDTAFEQVLRTKLRNSEDEGIRKDEKISSLKKQRNVSYIGNGILLLVIGGSFLVKRYL